MASSASISWRIVCRAVSRELVMILKPFMCRRALTRAPHGPRNDTKQAEMASPVGVDKAGCERHLSRDVLHSAKDFP